MSSKISSSQFQIHQQQGFIQFKVGNPIELKLNKRKIQQGDISIYIDAEYLQQKSNSTLKFVNSSKLKKTNSYKLTFQDFEDLLIKNFQSGIRKKLNQQNIEISNLGQNFTIKNYIRKKFKNKNLVKKCRSFIIFIQIDNLQEQKEVLLFQLQNHKKDIQFISNLHHDKELQIQDIRKSFQVQINQQQRNSLICENSLQVNKQFVKRQQACKQELEQTKKQLNDQRIQNKKLKNMYQSLQEINEMQKINYTNQLQELQKTFDQSQKQKQSYRTDLTNAQNLFNQLSTKKAKQIIELTQKYDKVKLELKECKKQISSIKIKNQMINQFN